MKTEKKNVCDLSGLQLDWAFAVAYGKEPYLDEDNPKCVMTSHPIADSGDFDESVFDINDAWLMMYLIEREKISVKYIDDEDKYLNQWVASIPNADMEYIDPNMLIAIASCFIASKLGDIVEVPILE